MSEWFDLCRGLRRIARHNSRCENGWLISFYSWHRGLSVWLCSLCSARGSHRLLAVTSLSPARRHGAHLSPGGQAAHTRPPGTQETHGASGRAAPVYGSDLARAEASSAASLADWSRAVHQAGGNWSVYRLPNCRPPGCWARLARPDPGLSQSPAAQTRSAPIFKNIRRQYPGHQCRHSPHRRNLSPINSHRHASQVLRPH